MRVHRALIMALLLGTLIIAGSAAAKGPLASGDFDIYSVDDQGGGWVINRIPVRGDLLWGCKDVAIVEECEPVPLPDFMPGFQINFLHISNDSQAGWLKVSVPALGDYLLARLRASHAGLGRSLDGVYQDRYEIRRDLSVIV